MKQVCLIAITGFLIMSMALPTQTFATEQVDIVSGLNVLPLMVTKITGDVTMAIIYDPADEASKKDAEGIKKIVDSGDSALEVPGGGKFSSMLVSVNEFGKLSRARVAFITSGLGAHFDDIGTFTSAASILTISTDINCVRAAKCIIGVVSHPALTIYFSKAAADSAKLQFSQTFSMLVKQP